MAVFEKLVSFRTPVLGSSTHKDSSPTFQALLAKSGGHTASSRIQGRKANAW